MPLRTTASSQVIRTLFPVLPFLPSLPLTRSVSLSLAGTVGSYTADFVFIGSGLAPLDPGYLIRSRPRLGSSEPQPHRSPAPPSPPPSSPAAAIAMALLRSRRSPLARVDSRVGRIPLRRPSRSPVPRKAQRRWPPLPSRAEAHGEATPAPVLFSFVGLPVQIQPVDVFFRICEFVYLSRVCLFYRKVPVLHAFNNSPTMHHM